MKTFTLMEQADNCERLATLLEHSNPEMYDHSMFKSLTDKPCGTVACALGWAAIAGIGDMSIDNDIPCMKIGDSVWFGAVESANHVFGAGSYDLIFSSCRNIYTKYGQVQHHEYTPDHGRQDSINLLRKHAAELREKKESTK